MESHNSQEKIPWEGEFTFTSDSTGQIFWNRMPMSLVYFLFYYFLTFGISFTSSSGKIFLVEKMMIMKEKIKTGTKVKRR